MARVQERITSSAPRAVARAPRVDLQPATWEILGYGVLVAIALATRLYDLGSRALHHDESLHAVFSWYLYVGRGYTHDPMMHGPAQFYVPALMYFLFGDSDTTARLGHALYGVALVALPYLLRHELGRRGALAASFLLTFSPSFLYFSRFAREDIFAAFYTGLVVVGFLGYVRTQRPRYFYTLATGTALLFATKEIVYIHGFIFTLFVLLWLVVERRFEVSPRLWPVVQSISARQWAIAVGIFLGIYVLFFTTFFTNLNGLYSGSIGAIAYWLAQQEVRRGGQPWFYYLMLVPLYEFLALTLAAAAVVWLRRWRNMVFSFTVFWCVGAFAIYSWAGEKMPWLVLHLTLPLIFLAAQFAEAVLANVTPRWPERHAWLAAGLTVLGVVVLVAWLNVSAVGALTALEAQELALRRLTLALAMVAVVGGLATLGLRHGWSSLRRPVGAAALTVLFAFTVHTGWQVTYKFGDIPRELLVYVQTSPDVPWVVRQIEQIGQQTGQGKNMRVLLDGGYTENGVQHESIAWPFEWYLRDWRGKQYFSKTIPQASLDEAAVVLVMAPNMGPVAEALQRDFVGQKYKLNWWHPEDYKSLTWQKVWEGLLDPVTRASLLQYLLYREPLGQLGAREFYFFQRADLPVFGPAPSADERPSRLTPRDDLRAQPGPAGTTYYGRRASGAAVLGEPKDVAVDARGRIYVVESALGRVTVFNPDGTVAASWGRTGGGEGEFRDPWGIAVAPDGTVYVADTWNHRVQKFDAEGRFLLQWGRLADAEGRLGVEPGGFWGPRDIAISSSGNVYVTDTGNKRVQVFTPEGEFVTMFGGGGAAPGQMDEPVGIAIAADGSIYVADTWNRRVQRFDAQHQFQGSWSVEGWEGQSVVNKPYLTVAPDGGVYAVVPERGEVVRLSPDGGVERLRLPSGLTLGLPIGIATDQAGALLVADSRNQVVVRVPRP